MITKDFGDVKDYFGIAKVKILPPRGLYHPVLPYRSNGNLKFPLCRTCADTENQNPCTCSEEERELTGTWCTLEIQTALRLGYTLKKIYEVYHWEETTQYVPKTREGGLFARYINTFLKFKQEASGPPDWINNERRYDALYTAIFREGGRFIESGKHRKEPWNESPGQIMLKQLLGQVWSATQYATDRVLSRNGSKPVLPALFRSHETTSQFSHINK